MIHSVCVYAGEGCTDKASLTGTLRYPQEHPAVHYIEAEGKLYILMLLVQSLDTEAN